ncbi:hypothetical protein GLW08_06865 [Pontibacillus yanchengensis]|uniref:Uncharacterized protein n=2 Tax=Pontibacillus yanchengensis TaxID=462910 RepID=A0ACC7VE51_9BACI|nr:hypothetical protein [Pontibacillus yanchengensis]MYL32477.1 hypothetical protein [Pontibacillus yanchengensis]MYL53058.1 hypothetical protein [Pontibacillus yanchengensis]
MGKRTIYGCFLGLVMLALLLPQQGRAETESGHDKGMWAWFPNDDIATREAREELIDFSKEKGVNVLYLNIGERGGDPYLEQHPEQYEAFIKAAHEHDIDVIALDGASEWARAENHYIPINRFRLVRNYNQQVPEQAQFDGIQFDIEPYLLPEWDTADERPKLIHQYLKGLNTLKLEVEGYAKTHDFFFMMAMPFWFDGSKYTTTYDGQTKPLSEHVTDTVIGGIAIMAYRDFAEGRDSILYHSETEMNYINEVQYARDIGTKAIIGVETQYLEPYEKVSFFEEGESYMDQELEIVDDFYSDNSGYGGQAIHKYQSYRSMKP